GATGRPLDRAASVLCDVTQGRDKMSIVNEPLLELLRAHGVEAVVQGDWITFPGRTVRANAAIMRELPQTSALTVQLDVRLEVGPGRTIVESFAGIGVTREKAIADAVHNLIANSFHVLLAAFFRPEDEQV